MQKVVYAYIFKYFPYVFLLQFKIFEGFCNNDEKVKIKNQIDQICIMGSPESENKFIGIVINLLACCLHSLSQIITAGPKIAVRR